MKHLQTFQIFPAVPEPIKFLEKLARNLWWCWHLDAIELFRRISPRLWALSGRNPLLFSTLIPQERLEELAHDESYLAHLRGVQEKFQRETTPLMPTSDAPYNPGEVIAYLSMEFGLHESVPIFAGGLGILAGDHLKSASDLGIPLVGVGLLYRQGYFRQFLNDEGWQQEEYPETNIFNLPLYRAKDAAGKEVTISVKGPEGDIHATVWLIKVGRVPLYLLDSNIPENPPQIRDITSRLYAGDPKQRLAQEVLLGVGGLRALAALGITPAICHMNEGHSAFCGLERICQIMTGHNVDLKTALEIVPRTTLFTTHTPVAAGHDEFPPDLVKPYLEPFNACLGTDVDEIISWGQPANTDESAPLSMFVLGLRHSLYHNGVSELHGRVARRMWAQVWPGWPEDEVPISHITNGIHIPSWISIENALLFERYLGPEWYLDFHRADFSKRIEQIYDEELWRAREMSRARLIRTCRELMVKQYSRRNAPKSLMREVETVLDPEVLTVAWGRRFATYKRGTLLLHSPERLERIINSEQRPIQFIFAGKAHPKDDYGKEMIKQVVAFSRSIAVRHRMVFLEDYDINIARLLVQGADVWLNTPRRPMEACGTSGMKAAVNGVLNVSVLDGWWNEGYSEERGWAIGHGEEYSDAEYQDRVDSQALFNLLENEVIPCFYDRQNGGKAPERWIQMMKASMQMAIERFSTHRMVCDYETQFYRPALKQYRTAYAQGGQKSQQLVAQRERLLRLWSQVKIARPVLDGDGPFRIGHALKFKAEIDLGEIRPEEVDVELYYGQVQSLESLSASQTETMSVIESLGGGRHMYGCSMTSDIAGRFGCTVRVSPSGDARLKYTPGLITWA